MDFHGSDYIPARDRHRLLTQHQRVRDFMLADGEWHTLGEISEMTGEPPASVSAQLRHLRKPEFGAYTVEKRYAGNGLWEYRVREGGVAFLGGSTRSSK